MHTRRDLFAGAGAVATASLIAASARTDVLDPAVVAVHDWLEKVKAVRAHTTPGDWDDDPHAVALDAAEEDAYRRMARTRPTTPEGIIALVRAHFFDEALASAQGRYARFENTATWNWKSLSAWNDERDRVLIETVLGAAS